mgnify:CR=1 FL=1
MYVSSTDAYQDASQYMPYEYANKYAQYWSKKQKTINSRRASMRDSGRSKVYTAENQAISEYEKNGGEILTFDTPKDAQKYIDRIIKSKTWLKLTESKGHRKVRLNILKDMGDRCAVAGQAHSDGQLDLAPRHMTQYVIIHELAHLAGNMHHDIGFRIDLVKLCSRFVGTEFAKILKKKFREKKLKMNVPQTIMDPVKWYESVKKMEKVRASV